MDKFIVLSSACQMQVVNCFLINSLSRKNGEKFDRFYCHQKLKMQWRLFGCRVTSSNVSYLIGNKWRLFGCGVTLSNVSYLIGNAMEIAWLWCYIVKCFLSYWRCNEDCLVGVLHCQLQRTLDITTLFVIKDFALNSNLLLQRPV